MGLVAEYEIRCEALPLAEVAAAVPAATMAVSMQYNHGRLPPFVVTLSSGPADAVEDAFASTPFVDEYALIGRAGDARRYQVLTAVGMAERLGDHVDDLDGLRDLATVDAVVDRIRVVPDGWVQTGWFADRAAFDAFRTFWRDEAGFSLRRLTRDGEPEPPGDGLTDPQREALRTAYEMGHFEIPRSASLDDVAAELDVSASALSERLRRAQTHLVETTVAPTWPPLPE